MRASISTATFIALLSGAAAACSSSAVESAPADSEGGASPPSAPLGDGPSRGDAGSDACTAHQTQAVRVKEPVDIIVIADTSNSMRNAVAGVRANINTKLAATLAASGLDYQVILLSTYGSLPDMCIDPPLGGAPCTPPPPKPAATGRFHHYVKFTGSKDMLDNIRAWYAAPDDSGAAPNGWKAWARPTAKKVFIAMSDTAQASNDVARGDAFDAGLLALDPAMFGTSSARRYVFHSIVGLDEKPTPTLPWLPTEPIVDGTCSGYDGNVGKGSSIQRVSVLSGGLRFPVCQSNAFDVVFNHIAKDVVETTKMTCDIPISLDVKNPDTLQIVYTPGGGGPEQALAQVAKAADCKPGAFFVESNVVHLCPEACATVSSDPRATLDQRYGCDVGFVK